MCVGLYNTKDIRTYPIYKTVIVAVLCNVLLRWWRGVVGNAFRLKRSYSMPGLVGTAMGDCLWAGKPSRCEACQLGRFSLLPFVGR